MVTYKVGDTIEYTTYGGDVRRVTVTAKHRNVKNGRAGFDAALSNSDGGGVSVWGYDLDVLRVILPTGEALVPYQGEPNVAVTLTVRQWELVQAALLRHLVYAKGEVISPIHQAISEGLQAAQRPARVICDMPLCLSTVTTDSKYCGYHTTQRAIAEARAPYQGEPGLEESKGDSIGQ